MAPTPINLEPWKDQIKQWLDEGLSYDEIRRNLWKEGGIQLSAKTFSNRLREWGIWFRKPAVSNDIPALRKRITEIFNEGQLTDSEAVQMLNSEGFNIRRFKYSKMRRDMGLHKRVPNGFRSLATQNTATAEAG